MSSYLPFTPSDSHYDFTVTLGDASYIFEVKWNSRDDHWYFDMYDADENPMVTGVKVVLGTFLGRKSAHPFFANNIIQAIDTTFSNQDPTFDDIGRRVFIEHLTYKEYLASINTYLTGVNGDS